MILRCEKLSDIDSGTAICTIFYLQSFARISIFMSGTKKWRKDVGSDEELEGIIIVVDEALLIMVTLFLTHNLYFLRCTLGRGAGTFISKNI